MLDIVRYRMKKISISFVVVLFILVGSFLNNAVALEGNGGYGSPQLASDYVQDLGSYTSNLVNPALLYRVNQVHLNFGIYRWGIFDAASDQALGYQQGSFLFPVRMNQTLGFTFISSGGSIIKNNGNVDVGSAAFGDYSFIGSYALKLFPWLSLGTNVKYVYQNHFGSGTSNGLGFDLGLYVNPFDHYRFGDLGISLNFQDIVPPAVIQWGSQNEIPARLRAGLRYSALNDRMIGDVEVLFDDWLSQLYGMAKEAYDSGKVVTPVRTSGHLKIEFIPQIWFRLGWANNAIPNFGINFNLMYPLPEMINYINNDINMGYSFLESERGLVFAYKLSFDMGPTREQREAKRMYDRLIIAPMNAYSEAMRLYMAGKYWEASFAFGKLMALYPNFNLNDRAAFYMGNCYRFLQMNTIARQVYKDALEEYPTSETRSKYLYGLQSLDYREGKYDDALKNHAYISNLYAESEIRPDADYLAGQIHFMKKNLNVAEQLFKKIEPESPSYLYAQYTLSIINIETNKADAAIANLKTIVSDSTKDAAELLLRDAANLKLGHIYFERGLEGDLRKAVDCYKRVPEGSSYGDEALLGTAWAWIKVGQAAACLSTCDRLIASHPESPLTPETYLVKGYSLMLQKSFSEAIDNLQKCLDLCKGDFITSDNLAARRSQFAGVDNGFQPTADEIKKNALRKPTDRTLEERVGLESKFKEFKTESDNYFAYVLQADSHSKFLRRKEEIQRDAEYALAKSMNSLSGMGQGKIIEKQKEKEIKLDDQIEKLKQQLQQIEKK